MRCNSWCSVGIWLAWMAGCVAVTAARADDREPGPFRLPPVDVRLEPLGGIPPVAVFDPFAPPPIAPVAVFDPFAGLPHYPHEFALAAAQEEPIPLPPVGPGDPPRQFGERPPEPEIRRVELAFLRTQNVLLRAGEWQFDYGFYYFNSEFDFPAVNGGFLTRADLVRRQFVVPFAFRYGWSDRLQLFTNVPVGWRHNEIVTSPLTDPNPIEINEEDFAIGDITLGASYHLWETDGCCPDVIFTGSVGLPTGEQSLVIAPLDGGLGTGFTSLSWQLLFIHTYDPVVVYWGFGHRHYFADTVSGIRVQPGEELTYQLGCGFAVNDRVTLSTAFLGSYVTQSEFDGDALLGSEAEPSRVRFALTALRNCRIVEPFVEIGTSSRAPQSRVGVTWTY
jgi:hypothetical protein